MKAAIKVILVFVMSIVAFPTLAQINKPLEISKIADGVYLHTSFKYVEGYGLVDSNGLVVLNNGQAYIVDTPWSEKDTERLLSWIADKGYEVEASISTHSHEDRTAGIALLNSRQIPTYTSELTKHILEREGKAVPTNYFTGSELVLGNGLVELYYPGAGHTEDNIVVWLPESQILFGGCLVRGHEWEGLGNVNDASINAWADSIRNIKSRGYAIQTVIPGHGQVGDASILDHTIDLAESADVTLTQLAR